MHIFDVVTFFSRLVVIQSTDFLEAVLIYKIHIFDEHFFSYLSEWLWTQKFSG